MSTCCSTKASSDFGPIRAQAVRAGRSTAPPFVDRMNPLRLMCWSRAVSRFRQAWPHCVSTAFQGGGNQETDSVRQLANPHRTQTCRPLLRLWATLSTESGTMISMNQCAAYTPPFATISSNVWKKTAEDEYEAWNEMVRRTPILSHWLWCSKRACWPTLCTSCLGNGVSRFLPAWIGNLSAETRVPSPHCLRLATSSRSI